MTARVGAAVSVGVLLLLALAPWVLGKGGLHLCLEMFVLLALAQVWNVLAGYGGLMSLGLQAFIGVGAYGLFFLSNSWNVSPYWVLPLVPALCAVFGAMSALLLFRLRDAYFVIGSWVLAEIAALLVAKAAWLGGSSGLSLLTTSLMDLRQFQRVLFWLSGAVAFAAAFASYRLLRSAAGVALMAARDNELAASSIGVNVWASRFVVFVLSAAAAGLVGAINYLASLYVNTGGAFDIGWSGAIIFIVVVGGIGTLEGPLVGTALYMALRELFTLVLPVSGNWYLVVMGSIAAATMVAAPRGLWPLLQDRLHLRGLAAPRELPRRVREAA